MYSLSNLPQYFQMVSEQLEAGNVQGAIMTLWNNVVVGAALGIGFPALPAKTASTAPFQQGGDRLLWVVLLWVVPLRAEAEDCRL